MTAVITNIEDLRVLAKQRVPRMFYDYADSGSWTESTYRANESDFAQDQAAPARGGEHGEPQHGARRWSASDVAMPVAIAPTGLTGMQHADGEILAARAAEAVRHPVHAVDDEHLLDRGHRRSTPTRRSGSSST